MLAMRIHDALEVIIAQDQKGFMSSRRISCNIRRVLDLIDLADKSQEDGVIVSIDFEKCFDLIETNALTDAMRYFNFGDSMIKWVQTIYKDASACVTNNGYFSDYYQVTRSVKQGGPCSAFFFLILAEVLAIELRKNPKLEGYMVKEVKRILGQYADDMDLYLKASKEALSQAFLTINKFQGCGFKVNYDKTTIYRIGSIRYSNAKFYTENPIQWSDKINVLGVDIGPNLQLLNMNYNELIVKSQTILDTWSSRSLSLIGKVSNCKHTSGVVIRV